MPLDFVNYDNPTLELLHKTDEYFNDPYNGWIQGIDERMRDGKAFRCIGGIMAYITTGSGKTWSKIPSGAWNALNESAKQIAPEFCKREEAFISRVAVPYNNEHTREEVHEMVKTAIVIAEAKALVEETV